MYGHSRVDRGRRSGVAVAFAALAMALSLILASCGSDTTATTPPDAETTAVTGQGGGTGVQVIMTNRSYDPQTVTVRVGDTVTWVNEDAPRHDVVADNGEFASQLFDAGQTFSFTFTEAGTYPYHCSIHPGMDGTVIVE